MIESDPRLSADHSLCGCHVAAQVAMEGAEPQPVVGQLGQLAADDLVEPERVLGQGQALQGAMGDMQHRSRRSLVDLAALDPDEAILDVVHATDTVGTGQGVEPLDELDRPEPFPVERNRDTTLEFDRDLDRVGRHASVHGPLVDVGRRSDPRILQHARLDRTAPQVDID